jgi:hypothetical protein
MAAKMKSSFDPSTKLSSLILTTAVLTLSGCSFTINGGYSFNFSGDTAESSEQGVFSDGIEQIEIVNRFGNVDITLAESDPAWTWESKVWADSQERADAYIKTLSMDVATDGNTQTWTIVLPESSSDLNGVQSNLTLKVPADVEVKLLNAHGNVKVEDVTAKVDLTNSHGNVNASRIANGSVVVRHGDTILKSASGEVSIESAHGNVSTSEMEGKLKVNGSHSSINVDRAQDVALYSSHGRITATNIHGDVIATNSHASIDITSFGASVSAKAEHGNIDLIAANPDFKSIVAEATHGSIKVAVPESVTPSIDLSTSHGDAKSEIDTNASSSQKVVLKTSHGNIRVTKSDLVAEVAQ